MTGGLVLFETFEAELELIVNKFGGIKIIKEAGWKLMFISSTDFVQILSTNCLNLEGDRIVGIIKAR